MRRVSPPPPDAAREHDANVIAHFVALVHARRTGNYLGAADAHRSLRELGVEARFPRRPKSQEGQQ